MPGLIGFIGAGVVAVIATDRPAAQQAVPINPESSAGGAGRGAAATGVGPSTDRPPATSASS
jgi:hypothetical protein